MKNADKNLSLLLIIGSVGALASVGINIAESLNASASNEGIESVLALFEAKAQPLTTTDALYYLMAISVSLAGIFFALSYRKGKINDFKLPGTFFLIAAVAELSGFMLMYGNNFLSNLHYNWLQVLIHMMLIASKVFTGLILRDKNQAQVKISWVILIYGGVVLSSDGDLISRFLSLFTFERHTILMRFQVFIQLFTILSPIAYILISNKLMDKVLIENPESKAVPDSLSDNDVDQINLENTASRKNRINWNDSYPVFWWLVTFLFSAIPFIGIGVLIYWSVAKSQFKRSGWAVANICVSFITTIFAEFYYRKLIFEAFSSTGFLVLLAATIIFYAIIITVCLVIYSRNQKDKNGHESAFSVIEWIGYSVLAVIPLVNIIVLIVFSLAEESSYRRNWSRGMLLFIPFSIVSAYSGGWVMELYMLTQ